jgi:hypothetical protein
MKTELADPQDSHPQCLGEALGLARKFTFHGLSTHSDIFHGGWGLLLISGLFGESPMCVGFKSLSVEKGSRPALGRAMESLGIAPWINQLQ